MRAGDVLEMPNGDLIAVEQIRRWSPKDGEVFGRVCRSGTWSASRYCGTVRGLEELRVKADTASNPKVK